MKISFIYLNFPFWRSEIGKIALFLGGIDFENRIISSSEFERVKKLGRLDDGTIIPFHQLPCLVVDGITIAQTGGISRFCGKLSGHYPKNNDILAAQIDQFLDFSTDITVLVAWTGKYDNKLLRITKRKELSGGELKKKLIMLEKSISKKNQWILGSNDLGLADIAIWRLMGWLTSGVAEGIPSDLLKDYPKITHVCQSVDKDPRIIQWIKKTYPKNYNRGIFYFN